MFIQGILHQPPVRSRTSWILTLEPPFSIQSYSLWLELNRGTFHHVVVFTYFQDYQGGFFGWWSDRRFRLGWHFFQQDYPQVPGVPGYVTNYIQQAGGKPIWPTSEPLTIFSTFKVPDPTHSGETLDPKMIPVTAKWVSISHCELNIRPTHLAPNPKFLWDEETCLSWSLPHNIPSWVGVVQPMMTQFNPFLCSNHSFRFFYSFCMDTWDALLLEELAIGSVKLEVSISRALECDTCILRADSKTSKHHSNIVCEAKVSLLGYLMTNK